MENKLNVSAGAFIEAGLQEKKSNPNTGPGTNVDQTNELPRGNRARCVNSKLCFNLQCFS